MNPVSPVMIGHDLPEVVYAKDQPEYKPLPVFQWPDGCTLSRWHMNWRERLRVLIRGDVYLWVNTFGQPLQPVMLQVEPPEMGEREGGAPASSAKERE